MKCPHCPLSSSPAPCWADANHVARICELIRDGDAGFRGMILGGGPAPAPEANPPIPLAVNLAVVRCPARGAPIECGCSVERRYCGETLDVMVWDGCVACQLIKIGETDHP